ncbi:glucose-1-phosphate thymidylyltransferase [Nonomuraea zeae]|uniref:Glucose-1-phosphate thymidylyltransferase n=1 Tax=Nonomuraea zeae TaxID=1642303 RepID=A0A5S4GVB3_9ACTN|nr:glucose-1-phosphate thymidylyltransferase [Nonomuraea zeae]TMR36709.1 glucose-1-phosphate thymidylyltransferase [Nonomuraea zeae]
MKALVLAGGSGTRLRPLSHAIPKQLIPVAGKPVLVHCLENIAAIGVTEVGIIVGDRGDEMRAVLGDGSALGLRITYIRQLAPLGLAHCVQLAQDFLGDDDFVMYLGDNILAGDGISGIAAEFAEYRPAAHILLTKVANPREYGVAELDGHGRVVALAEKPAQPRSDLALTGVYFFTRAIHQAVRAISPSARGELEITDAIAWLLADGQRIRATQFHGYWKDTGKIDDLLECHRVLMGHRRGDVRGSVDAVSLVSGDVVVEPGAQIIESIVTGPAVIGAGSVVRGSRIGPYTALGSGCTLVDAGIEHSIVLDGVSVQNVRGIYGSLIGREAAVCSAVDDGHRRLVIGDHSTVEVA